MTSRAEEGDYVVCLEWLRYRQTGSLWVGPDKFGGKYKNPAKSEIKISIKDSAVKIPAIESSTSGVAVAKQGKQRNDKYAP